MTKKAKKKRILIESDFRLIKQSIESHIGKKYTTEYIRKVYNGMRQNEMIINEIDHYVKLKLDFESNLKK